MAIANATMFRDDAGLSPLPGLNGAVMPTQASTTLFPRFYTEIERKIVAGPDGNDFHEVEYVEILLAGDVKSAPIRRVTPEWLEANQQFYPAYEAWKRGQQASATGTPLEDWTGIGKAQVFQAKALNIFTVEQLTELNDHGLRALGMGARELQAKAKLFLERRADEKAAERAVAQNVQLTDQLESANATIAALTARLEALENAAKTLSADKATSAAKR